MGIVLCSQNSPTSHFLLFSSLYNKMCPLLDSQMPYNSSTEKWEDPTFIKNMTLSSYKYQPLSILDLISSLFYLLQFIFY